MSHYATDAAFRAALEQRLLSRAQSTGVNLDRLRRQVVLERLLVRLETAEPGVWVLKGAMALEVRLGTAARATLDVDLGQRAGGRASDFDALANRLANVLATPGGDPFVYRLVDVRSLLVVRATDVARARVECRLAGRPFGHIQVDIASRDYELSDTERIRLPSLLAFDGIAAPEVEAVSLDRHVAEKFHAMLLRFSDRENTRVRDLADLVILREHGLIEPTRAAKAVRRVFTERETEVPAALPPFPSAWPERYERIAREHAIGAVTFAAAEAVVTILWNEMFPSEREDS